MNEKKLAAITHAIARAVVTLTLVTLANHSFAAMRSAGEGFVQVPGGPVWYRVFGSGNATPLVMVHGGPGGSSCAFEPVATLVGGHRPVIVYDQLGSGRSGRPMKTALWNTERSMQELAALRAALGLERIHLLGHSWGGALVADYVITQQPRGIESLILSAPLLSTKVWIDDATLLRKELPVEVQETLKRNEQAGTLQSQEYHDATDIFYSHFLYHQVHVKKPDACAEAPANNQIYQLMWGPTEFNATGTLLNFDVTPRLHELTMPVLLLAGRYDEARPETLQKFQALIPGSSVTIFENSGHMAPLEEYEAYARALESFLDTVDKTSKH